MLPSLPAGFTSELSFLAQSGTPHTFSQREAEFYFICCHTVFSSVLQYLSSLRASSQTLRTVSNQKPCCCLYNLVCRRCSHASKGEPYRAGMELIHAGFKTTVVQFLTLDHHVSSLKAGNEREKRREMYNGRDIPEWGEGQSKLKLQAFHFCHSSRTTVCC